MIALQGRLQRQGVFYFASLALLESTATRWGKVENRMVKIKGEVVAGSHFSNFTSEPGCDDAEWLHLWWPTLCYGENLFFLSNHFTTCSKITGTATDSGTLLAYAGRKIMTSLLPLGCSLQPTGWQHPGLQRMFEFVFKRSTCASFDEYILINTSSFLTKVCTCCLHSIREQMLAREFAESQRLPNFKEF